MLDLPLDLRLMVYEYVVSKQIWPKYYNHARRCLDRVEWHERYSRQYRNKFKARTHLENELRRKTWFDGISTGIYPMTLAKVQKQCCDSQLIHHGLPENAHVGLGPTEAEEASARSLLRVNRQIRKEFAPIVWGRSIKRFNKLDVFDEAVWCLRKYCTDQQVLGHVFEARDPLVLSRIPLSFINREYLQFVGYRATNDLIRKNKRSRRLSGLNLLSHIHTLQHLNLQFQIMRSHHYPTDYEITEWDPWSHDHPRGFCQKKFIDVILTLGYELLRGIQKVTISGHVGKSNHENWEPLLRDQLPPWSPVLRRHWPLGKPRERRDMTADVARILAMPYE